MSLNTWLLRGALLAAAMPVVAPSDGTNSLTNILMGTAQADVYHAVESGETLSSVAARYKIEADVLRSVNKLSGIADNSVLPAMLLRIPDGKDKATVAGSFAKTATASTAITSTSAATTQGANAIASNPAAREASSDNEPAPMVGTLYKSLGYVVQAGDTVESIAERHVQAGYNVTADIIRQKNNLSGQPSAGRTLIIPLQSVSYRPLPQQSQARQTPKATTTQRASAATGGGATMGGEVQVSEEMWMPLPQAQVIAPRDRFEQRGPSLLSSRSYSPSDGVRVLGQEEEAPNVGRTPRSRSRVVVPAPSPTPSLARVARVSRSGARIRRLPESEAVTLYRCAVGTEIAVTRQSGSWSAILMSDRSTGWIPSRYLNFTGESVDVSTQVMMAAAPTYGNGYNGKYAYDGSFSSNHPAVAQALTWLGTPYVYGGESRRGIDCSALVQSSFRACGYRLPRTAAQQSRVGMAVDPANLQPGDRLYFSASGTRVDHTGLYMGNGLFVHASGRGRGVIVSNLFDSRNWNIFVGARR